MSHRNQPIRRTPAPTPAPTASNSCVTLKKLWVFPRDLQWVETEPARSTRNGFSVDCQMSTRSERRIEYHVVMEATFHKKGIYAVFMTSVPGGATIQSLTKDDNSLRVTSLETMTIAFDDFTAPFYPKFNIRFERIGDLPKTVEETIDNVEVVAEKVKATEAALADAAKDDDAKPR